MEKLYKTLDEVISCIKESNEYKDVLKLKRQMSNNNELVELINKVKVLQKKYIKNNYDKMIKKELDILENKLYEIPLYNNYIDKLSKVNEKINYIKEYLNDYFFELCNEKD